MKTTLRTDITIRDICEGFVYNELEGKGLYQKKYSKKATSLDKISKHSYSSYEADGSFIAYIKE